MAEPTEIYAVAYVRAWELLPADSSEPAEELNTHCERVAINAVFQAGLAAGRAEAGAWRPIESIPAAEEVLICWNDTEGRPPRMMTGQLPPKFTPSWMKGVGALGWLPLPAPPPKPEDGAS